MTIEQGYDPRHFKLVAFGGAGPLHANALGKLINSFPVIIPSSPGVLCALGDANTTLRHEMSQPFVRLLSNLGEEKLVSVFENLSQEGRRVVEEQQGVPPSQQVSIWPLPHPGRLLVLNCVCDSIKSRVPYLNV